jgi:WD40 repeat protein
MIPVVGSVVVLGALGLALPAVLAAVVGAAVLAVLVVRSFRISIAAIDAESAPQTEYRFPPGVEPFPGRATWVDVDPAEWTPEVEAPRTRVLGKHKGDLLSVTTLVLPDGTPVAITGGRDNTARVWDLSDDSWRHTLDGHTHDVVGIAAMVLPDGVPVVVTISPDRTVRVWDLRDGSLRNAPLKPGFEPHGVSCLSLADGTPVVVVHNVSEGIRMWDLRDHKMAGKVAHGSYDGFVDAMFPVVLPDGTAVALASDWEGPIKALDLKTGKTRFQLLGHTHPVRSIDTTVLPDGTPIAVSVSGDKTIRIWDLHRRTLRNTITGLLQIQEAVVCTSLPDGTPIAVACDYERNTTVRDLRDGSELPYRLELWGDLLSAVTLPDKTLILGLSDDDSAVAVHPLT